MALGSANPQVVQLIDEGLEHHGAGRLDEAERIYERVLAIDSRDPDALHLLGVLAHQRHDHARAIELIEQAISIDPTYPGYHNNLGEAYRSLGQYDKATAAYREAIRLEPQFAEPANNLSIIMRQTGQIEDAINLARRAIQLNPGFAEAWNNLGLGLLSLKQLHEAIAAYRRALELNGRFVEAWTNLAFALIAARDYAGAERCCREAIGIDPDCYDAWRHLGSAHEKRDMREEAIDALKQALRCRPGCRDALFQLAAITQSEIPAAAPREYVMALFDQYAPSFDEHLTRTLGYRVPQHIREALVSAGIPSGIEVLDLGCGTGLSGAALRDVAKHLIGVDLSPGMVARARERKIYDELIVGDLMAALQHLARPVGAIVACDVFVYIGDLADIFRSASAGLTGGGLFAFSVEADDSTETFALSRKRRYTHSMKYIRALAAANRFGEVSSNLKPLRSEGGHDVMGWIVVLRRDG